MTKSEGLALENEDSEEVCFMDKSKSFEPMEIDVIEEAGDGVEEALWVE